jgi:hypothetical protein
MKTRRIPKMRISDKARKDYTYGELQYLIKHLEREGILFEASDIWLLVEENEDFDEDDWFDLQDWMREFYISKGYFLDSNGKFLTYNEFRDTHVFGVENNAWD